MKAAKRTKGFFGLVLILAISVIAEIVFSNFVWLAYVAGKDGVRDFVPYESESVEVNAARKLVDFDCDNFRLNSVTFSVANAYPDARDSYQKINFYVFDENSTYSAAVSRTENIAVGSAARRYKVYLGSYGNASGVSIEFPDTDTELILSDVVVNESYEFSFNTVRFAVVAVLLLIIYMFSGAAGKQLRDEMTYNNAAMIACSVSCFVSFVAWLLYSSCEDGNYITYPLDGGPEYWQPYLQQFDAFIKGQLHLDVEPTKELLMLENPYVPDARNGIGFMYDRAFYNGNYYSYFGVAPILAVYLPFYLITGNLPTDSLVMAFFSLVTALFLPWAVIEWAKLRKENIRPWFACVCALGAYFASGVLLVQRGRMPFYYIASIAGMAFISAFLFFILKAYNFRNKAARIIMLFFAGLSFGLAFHSRINSVVAPAVLVAVFVIIYFIRSIKEKKLPSFFGEMFVLALPVAAAVGASLYYNYLRFGDILQFGADYQLTVFNASLYEVSASGLAGSIHHFFLQPFVPQDIFPYIQLGYHRFADYGKNMYTDSNFGIFAFPFMLSLLLSPVLLKSKKISGNGKAMLSASIVSLLLTAFLDFCMGGVIFRYTTDISLVAAFVSAAVILEACFILQRDYPANVACVSKKAVTAGVALTAVFCIAVAISLNGNFVEYDPDYYCAFKDFFAFWN